MNADVKTYILGAVDPEMDSIEEYCKLNNIKYRFAEIEGKRVNPGNAYKYQPTSWEVENCIFIECGEGENLNRIDHHRPGDPGWGLKSIESSSLFQFLRKEDLSPINEDYCIAALDVDAAGALNNNFEKEFYGANESACFDMQIKNIASVGPMNYSEIFSLIKKYQDDSSISPYLGVGYNQSLLCFLTARMIDNNNFSYTAKDSEEGDLKICYKGSEDFILKSMANMEAKGLKGIYSNPVRGYCGGYYS